MLEVTPKRIKNQKKEWFFLGLVIFLYIITACFNLELLWRSWRIFQQIIWQVLPVVILVFTFIFLGNLFLDKKRVLKYWGGNNYFKKYFLAIVFGLLSSGPIYMWYPLLSDLKVKGAGDDVIAIFLYNRAVKLPLMPMIVYYFGWSFLVVITFLMIVFSVLNGWLVNKLVNNKFKNK